MRIDLRKILIFLSLLPPQLTLPVLLLHHQVPGTWSIHILIMKAPHYLPLSYFQCQFQPEGTPQNYVHVESATFIFLSEVEQHAMHRICNERVLFKLIFFLSENICTNPTSVLDTLGSLSFHNMRSADVHNSL